MGINVQLRDENGKVVREVDDPAMTFSRAASCGHLAGTQLLRYIVPWGDTVFNSAQAGDLLLDVRNMGRANRGNPLGNWLTKIEPLVAALATGTHVYLWFVGD